LEELRVPIEIEKERGMAERRKNDKNLKNPNAEE